MGFQGWMESRARNQFFDWSQTNQTPLSILGKLDYHNRSLDLKG